MKQNSCDHEIFCQSHVIVTIIINLLDGPHICRSSSFIACISHLLTMPQPTSVSNFEGGLDSQDTLDLVNPGASEPAPHTLIYFIRDNMKNTEIISSTNEVLYTVITDPPTNMCTTVYRGNASPDAAQGDSTAIKVAEIKRKFFRKDRIKFEGSPSSVKLSKWLRGAKGKWPDL